MLPHGLSNTIELYDVMKRLRTLMDDDVDGVSDAAYQLQYIWTWDHLPFI